LQLRPPGIDELRDQCANEDDRLGIINPAQ
jgi:hypothetical protein